MSKPVSKHGSVSGKVEREVWFGRAGNPDQLRKDMARLIVEDARWRIVGVYHDGFYHCGWMLFEP